MRLFIIGILSLFLSVFAYSQNTFVFQEALTWIRDTSEKYDVLLDGLDNSNEGNKIAFFHKSIPFSSSKLISVRLFATKTEPANLHDQQKISLINSDFQISAEITEVRGNYFLNTTVNPFRRSNNGNFEKLLSFSYEISSESLEKQGLRGPENTFNSVLSTGDLYKISVDKTGIYKIDKTFLETKLGIDVSKINPKMIKIFGAGGGRLPEMNSVPRTDDLSELRIFVAGESDNKFDNSDYIIFYAEGADIWKYRETTNTFTFDKNIYDDKNYYFIKIDGQEGLRVKKNNLIGQEASIELSNYDMLQRLEEDKINLLGSFSGTEGTGKEWYGDLFSTGSRERIYTPKFDFSGFISSEPLEVEMTFAGRSNANSTVNLTIGSKTISKIVPPVSVLDAESLYARKSYINESFSISDINPQVKVSYPQSSGNSDGWLDFLQIINSRNLVLNNTQLPFRSRKSKSQGVAAFVLGNYTNQIIWDVTNPFEPVEYSVSDNKLLFRPEGTLREFIAHNNTGGAYEPLALGKISNQNLHAIKDEDMIVVTHPIFLLEAQRLAEHRKNVSGLKIVVATTDQVYNEFSSGRVDPASIRDLSRLLLSRNPNFKYLLLFGDGSYDYKRIVKDLPSENFVPVYETDESLDPIDGFPSDDFYGLLGQEEGADLKGGLDIYVGRLPAKTLEEANILVNKIIHYETSPKSLGDWKMRAGYVADDEDGNTHLRDMDEIAMTDEKRHILINQQKVYADAYKQVSTPGENRYPDANRNINDNIFKGQLSLTYLGHGGPLGWAQERILTIPEIRAWTNLDKMVIMVTATCSFAAYDDPAVLTPAEYAMLNPKGGAIALLSTTRAVYTNSNKILTDGVHELMFSKINGQAPTLGYILAESKNKYQGDFFRINSRKFTLLGDPSLRVALPRYNIVTTKVNNTDAMAAQDTLSALEKVALEGEIRDDKGVLISSFNGTIFPTVFDKKTSLQTLSNDSGSPKYTFTTFRNILFKGAATVQEGKWSVTFWMPKNINYSFGNPRISYYANNGFTDAGGVFTNVIVGGSNNDLVTDDQGPVMDVFMNDESFISGGITNENPVLILNLKDDFGINVTGNAIGQDITAVIDGNYQNIYTLNEFYEAAKDDYSKGKVQFPLTKLSKGSHYIIAKAWDIAGNSTEKRVDFVVADIGDNKLRHVYNYPNPFSTNTFFQFEHDLVNTELETVIDIYTITGKLIKSIIQTKYSSGFRVNDISWNGRDDFDSSLARGIYLYKIKVHSKELNQTRESSFEKLIKL